MNIASSAPYDKVVGASARLKINILRMQAVRSFVRIVQSNSSADSIDEMKVGIASYARVGRACFANKGYLMRYVPHNVMSSR